MKFKQLLSASLALIGLTNSVEAQKKPNILFILIDDMGYPAIECYGNKMVKTPNIDKIAEQGVKFTQAYVCPQSTPTRASLLTGQYTSRNQMWHVVPKYGNPFARVKEPEYLDNLPREQFTIAEALKTAGYTTALLGKWHLSTYDMDGYYTYLYPDKARFYGFDYVNPQQNPTEYGAYGDKGVNFLTDEAIGFMKKNKNHPFFIYLSHHTIHNKVLAPKELVKKYLDLGYPETGLNFAEYLAAIEHLDNSIGRLQAKMKELGIDKNTIVFFVSDNGGVDSQLLNTPLRYGKGSAYEGGTRVPFMVQWPEKIKGGQVNTTPVHIVDIYPTLLDVAKIKPAPNHVLDGVDLLPLLFGNKNAEAKLVNRPIYFYQPLYDLLWGATPSASMVEGDYKLIWFFGDYIDRENNNKYISEGRMELYNLKDDIGEKHDLATVNADQVIKMKEKLQAFILESGSIIPGLNDKYNFEKWNIRSPNNKKEE